MAEGAYQEAISRYRAGLQDVLGDGPRLAAAGAGDLGDDVLRRSQEIEVLAAQNLAAGDGDVRELAALQLAAGAALDVAAARDIFESQGPRLAGDGGSEFDRTYAELRDIIDADAALGVRALVNAPMLAATITGTDKAGLAARASRTIDDLSSDARKIAEHAIGGLFAVSGSALVAAFDEAADRLLAPLYDRAQGIIRLAIRHLAKAVSKLLRLLGPLERPARRWLQEKLSQVARDQVVGFLVERALEVPRLRTEVAAQIDGAAADGDRFDVAAAELGSLSSRFGRHEKIITIIATVLGKLRAAILALASWAAVAMAGLYGLLLIYGVWVAGDFLDWYRTQQEGRLDMVAGVRSIVSTAVASSAL